MRRGGYLSQLQMSLPTGASLYLFDPRGCVHAVRRDSLETLDPVRRADDRPGFLRFIDEGQFTRYFIGNAATSDLNPSNATTKLGVMRPHSAFTPHAHGAEHYVLSLGYASCGLYDEHADRVTHVRLFPGCLLHIPPMLPHSFNNRAGDPLLLFVSNTGMGIDHENYAITASQAEQRAAQPVTAIGNNHDAPHAPAIMGQPPDYGRLAAALRQLEREMADAPLHTRLNWRERLGAYLHKWAWLLEAA